MALRAASLLLGLLLAACGQQAEPGGLTGEPAEGGPLTIQLRSGEEEPTAVLSYGGAEQAGSLGTHCWATQCVDFVAPPTPQAFTPVPANAEIEFGGDGTAESLSVGRPTEDPLAPPADLQEVRIRNGRAQLELEPGRYVLVLFGLWEDGDAIFTFGVEAA
ncbi:MAG: hypothetical protein ACRDH9_03705 [Actinomycetota bacterium]